MKLLHKILIAILFLIFFLVLNYIIKENIVFAPNKDVENSIENKYNNDLENIKTDSNNISVYFCPEDNCSSVLLNLIENTKESIWCAMYDFSSREIYDALLSKKNEDNIDLKLVTDLERSNSSTSLIGLLKSQEIPTITSPSTEKLMHNKFCVFDNNITMVGSMNFTDNCLYKNNNNILVIEDEEISLFFSEKINSYFQGDFYNDSERKLEKEDMNIFFCPDNDCKKIILEVFKNTEASLDCMYFTFTLNDAIYELQENNNYENIQKRFILEKRSISEYSVYSLLQELDIPVILDENPNTMHHKFCVVDNNYVLTGSLNLTARGPTNEESIVFIYDESIVNEYNDYFNNYWDLWSIEEK